MMLTGLWECSHKSSDQNNEYAIPPWNKCFEAKHQGPRNTETKEDETEEWSEFPTKERLWLELDGRREGMRKGSCQRKDPGTICLPLPALPRARRLQPLIVSFWCTSVSFYCSAIQGLILNSIREKIPDCSETADAVITLPGHLSYSDQELRPLLWNNFNGDNSNSDKILDT